VIVLGIDPGLDGAVAWVDSRGGWGVSDIPTIALLGTGMVKRRVDGKELIWMLRSSAVWVSRDRCVRASGVMGG
jgi:hypothetical protein